MTIQALQPQWAAPVRATTAAAEAPRERYLPAEEGTLPQTQPQAADKLAACRVLQQAGLPDALALVIWISTAAPEGTSLEGFARRMLAGVREVTPDVRAGVGDLVRLAETSRRAELQESPDVCLEQGLEALQLTYGPLEHDPARCSQFRGLLSVLGQPRLTYHLLTDELPAGVDRQAVIHEVVRDLRERHEQGLPLERQEALKIRDEVALSLSP